MTLRLGRRSKILLLLALVVALGAFVGRSILLQSLGGLLVVDDSLQPSDIAIMTTAIEPAGEIELADLFSQHMANRVGALIPAPSPADRELARRGVTTDGPGRILAALGVPREAVVLIPAGEGGTTDGMEALAKWCLADGTRRVIVVTAPDHARRVRRALARAFGRGGPEVLVHTVRYDEFRRQDWWQNRRTLRSGLVELEKLVLDYVQHPLH